MRFLALPHQRFLKLAFLKTELWVYVAGEGGGAYAPAIWPPLGLYLWDDTPVGFIYCHAALFVPSLCAFMTVGPLLLALPRLSGLLLVLFECLLQPLHELCFLTAS
jgi:hypothetical protein